ncbi:MAG: anchored repeat ABC transporter, substrate-binding protein [Corynebacterium sp.]|nr:anchored repeat ABC transporter, substrate-binding protein [Corynebacterium sp.]
MRLPLHILSLCAVGVLAGCAVQPAATSTDGLRVVATTPIMADIARNIVGPQDVVTSLVPPGADPHTFEPSLRTVREAAYADLALANGLLLEPRALMGTIAESSSAPLLEVGDASHTYGSTPLALVEDVSLDTVWLGLRIAGATDEAEVELVDASGPGKAFAYVTSTFGVPEEVFGTKSRAATLPHNAHMHLSWAFTEPGLYKLTFQGKTVIAGEDVKTARSTINIAVGVDPYQFSDHVVSSGHLDIAADFDRNAVVLRDVHDLGSIEDSIVAVGTSTLQPLPADPAYRFIATPGTEVYLLPQAVLGKHIHGEIDPHMWHNAANALAYVDVITNQLAVIDPSRGDEFRERAANYAAQIREMNHEVTQLIESIPPSRRYLVTPHHGYGYLDQGYGMKTAGFVTANNGVEASPRDVIALRRTLENLQVPAVFIEPNETAQAATLREVARNAGVKVCTIYGDTLDAAVPTYIDLMKHNAREFTDCLGAKSTTDTLAP